MNVLRKKFLFVVAAGVATWGFIQSPSAQTAQADHAAVAQSTMEEAIKGMGVQPQSSTAAQDKANAAMATPDSLPTQVDRNAAAAMSK